MFKNIAARVSQGGRKTGEAKKSATRTVIIRPGARRWWTKKHKGPWQQPHGPIPLLRRYVTPANTQLMDGMQIEAHSVKQSARKDIPPNKAFHEAKHRLTPLPRVHHTQDLPIMCASCPPSVQILHKTKHLSSPFTQSF